MNIIAGYLQQQFFTKKKRKEIKGGIRLFGTDLT